MEDDPQQIENRKGRTLMQGGVPLVPISALPQVAIPSEYNRRMDRMFRATGNVLSPGDDFRRQNRNLLALRRYHTKKQLAEQTRAEE